MGYVDFQVFGILLPLNCSYAKLLEIICKELKLVPDTSVIIEYQVKDGYPAFKINDDQNVCFYIELKRRDSEITTYPLSITTKVGVMQQSSSSYIKELSGDDMCIEGASTDGFSCNNSRNNSEGSSKEIVDSYVDYAEDVSSQIIEMSTEAISEVDIIDISKDDIISNKQNKDLRLHQIYKDKETLQMVLSLYAINNNFQFRVKKSSNIEYYLICYDKNCSWLLRASKYGKTDHFIIRRFIETHTCSLDVRFKSQRQASTIVIADIIRHKFSNIKTKYSVADIVRDMKHDFNVEVNYNKAWRSKERALDIMRGNATESFAKLYKYLYMLYTTNQGSVVEL